MGKIICTGLGPGDADLMSLRAHRAVTWPPKSPISAKRAAQAKRGGS